MTDEHISAGPMVDIEMIIIDPVRISVETEKSVM